MEIKKAVTLNCYSILYSEQCYSFGGREYEALPTFDLFFYFQVLNFIFKFLFSCSFFF